MFSSKQHVYLNAISVKYNSNPVYLGVTSDTTFNKLIGKLELKLKQY